MDFSAWHEVYLGGRWWALDGRHNEPRIGRILMATGRDAVDVALTTQFGPGWLQSFNVITEEIRNPGPEFQNAGWGYSNRSIVQTCQNYDFGAQTLAASA